MALAENLNAFWISKLGADRLAQLPGGSNGRSSLEKALNVVRELKKDRDTFYNLLFEGFDGYFHQSVFARALGKKSMAATLSQLQVGKAEKDVEWWATHSPKAHHVRVLAGVRRQMQFLTEKDVAVRHVITIPVLIEAVPSLLRVRTLTVQSTPATWSELLGDSINRILTPVVDADLLDQALAATGAPFEDLGEMVDLSAKAVALMKDTTNVYTYAGTFAVRTVGQTRHATGGGGSRKRQPLHLVMTPEFDELVASARIRQCEIEVQQDFGVGLLPGTALVIYPVEGKIVFRRMLTGGAVDAFLAYLAR
jgi:hypothetical protein